MGLDGGTKITRSDVLRGQSWKLATQDESRSTRGGCISTSAAFKERHLDKATSKQIRWTTCALSEQPLEMPIVADFLGNLYNKSAVLTFLLNRKGTFEDDVAKHSYRNILQSHGSKFAHLQRRRDVFQIHVTMNSSGRIECPISGCDCMSTPFSALASCGHVFSARAIEQMNDGRCMTCAEMFDKEEDVIRLNCEQAAQQKSMEENLMKRRRAVHSQRSKRKSQGLDSGPHRKQKGTDKSSKLNP